jgi:hypothetical protein
VVAVVLGESTIDVREKGDRPELMVLGVDVLGPGLANMADREKGDNSSTQPGDTD